MDWKWLHLETTRFEMGSGRLAHTPDADDEGPTRMVTVGSFSITAHCISTAQFQAFVESTGYVTTAEAEGSGLVLESPESTREWVPGANWRHPHRDQNITAVDHDPVVQVSWFDCQEFCRWSGTVLPTEAQWERAFDSYSDHEDHQVSQWCSDFYDPTFHRREQRVNPTGPIAGSDRVVRGQSTVRTERQHELPDLTSNRLGFRVVRGRLWQGTLAELR